MIIESNLSNSSSPSPQQSKLSQEEYDAITAEIKAKDYQSDALETAHNQLRDNLTNLADDFHAKVHESDLASGQFLPDKHYAQVNQQLHDSEHVVNQWASATLHDADATYKTQQQTLADERSLLAKKRGV